MSAVFIHQIFGFFAKPLNLRVMERELGCAKHSGKKLGVISLDGEEILLGEMSVATVTNRVQKPEESLFLGQAFTSWSLHDTVPEKFLSSGGYTVRTLGMIVTRLAWIAQRLH